MLVVKIALGLAGLGIVVFFHELGHFIAARIAKIDIEAFSIGWGKPVLKKKIGKVEYRLGMFPVGGYCKMKGETDYKEAWENIRKGIKSEEGSYLASGPASRILVSFGGPFFNLLFAVVLFTVMWGIGFDGITQENKIILSSEVSPDYFWYGNRYFPVYNKIFPADTAGLKTGDIITEINGNKVSYSHEIQENIIFNPEKPLPITVLRDGKNLQLTVTPYLDKTTGAGRIGITFWSDPVIESIKDDSLAHNAELLPGDRIISVNGISVSNRMDIIKILIQKPNFLVLEYDRNGITGRTEKLKPEEIEKLGISWTYLNYHNPSLPPHAAVVKGVKETYKTFVSSIKSLRLLFKGIDLTQAVSGPVRITYLMGDIAAQGFEKGIGTALRSMFMFLSIISIALCIMNLLPLPILDGGMIILFLIELIRKKPAHPKAISVFQSCGMVIIFGLMIFALFGDILFFIHL
jgi:regulator of sigma E protease